MTDEPKPARIRAEDLPPEHLTALTDLVHATFQLSRAVATTDVEAEELVQARKVLEETTELLARRTRERAVRRSFESAAAARATGAPYRLSALNPWGVPFEIELTDSAARASLVANALHEGPTDSVHGGVGAWLMDCMLGMLLQADGRVAVTARLAIDYRARTPLDRPLELHSRITAVEGRKVYAEGWIEHDGVRTLEATGLFLEIDPSVRR